VARLPDPKGDASARALAIYVSLNKIELVTLFFFTMIKWKWITARSISVYATNETPDTIQALIKKNLADGWFLKGEMLRAHPTSEIWVQQMGKEFRVQN
jgi:hypothetical protein